MLQPYFGFSCAFSWASKLSAEQFVQCIQWWRYGLEFAWKAHSSCSRSADKQATFKLSIFGDIVLRSTVSYCNHWCLNEMKHISPVDRISCLSAILQLRCGKPKYGCSILYDMEVIQRCWCTLLFVGCRRCAIMINDQPDCLWQNGQTHLTKVSRKLVSFIAAGLYDVHVVSELSVKCSGFFFA